MTRVLLIKFVLSRYWRRTICPAVSHVEKTINTVLVAAGKEQQEPSFDIRGDLLCQCRNPHEIEQSARSVEHDQVVVRLLAEALAYVIDHMRFEIQQEARKLFRLAHQLVEKFMPREPRRDEGTEIELDPPMLVFPRQALEFVQSTLDTAFESLIVMQDPDPVIGTDLRRPWKRYLAAEMP